MLIVCVLVLVVLGVILLVGRSLSKSGPSAEGDTSCGTCTGRGDKCEQDCMLEAAVRPIEYYDDEELDAFRGRPSADYTEEETEQFREVLYTMRPDEVAGWNRSLALRGIQVPDQLKDELMMLLEG